MALELYADSKNIKEEPRIMKTKCITQSIAFSIKAMRLSREQEMERVEIKWFV